MWVGGCSNGLSFIIKYYAFIKRVVRAGDDERVAIVRRPVKQILYATIYFEVLFYPFGQLDILYAPPW